MSHLTSSSCLLPFLLFSLLLLLPFSISKFNCLYDCVFSFNASVPALPICYPTSNSFEDRGRTCFCPAGFGGLGCNQNLTEISSNSSQIIRYNQDCHFVDAGASLEEKIKFCGCNIGYGGSYCHEKCPLDCSGRGDCIYLYKRQEFVCACSRQLYSGVNCENAYYDIMIIVYEVRLGIGIALNFILLVLSWVMLVANWTPTVAAWCRKKRELPSMSQIALLLLSIALLLRLASEIMTLSFLATATFSANSDYILKAIASVLVIYVAILIIFRWLQLSVVAIDKSYNFQACHYIGIAFLFILVLLLLIAALVVTAIPSASNFSPILAPAVFVFFSILLPVVLTSVGISIAVTLKKGGESASVLSLRFVQFIIVQQVATILLAACTIISSISYVVNENYQTFDESKVPANAIYFAFLIAERIFELVVYSVLLYLLLDLKLFKKHILCCQRGENEAEEQDTQK